MINKNLSKRKESKFASKNSRGITLIALVVTIVVLVILATVRTAQASVSLSATPVASSTPSSAATSTRLLQSRFRCSTSRFRQSFPELLQRFLIPATPTLTLLSGRRRLRTSLLASSRTSLSTQTTKLARLSLLPVQSSNL